ncbi:MAG: hypothetical protein PVSMB8_00660 [Vulcanimicrobiaceae bacterium]
MSACACGCGADAHEGKRYIVGHNTHRKPLPKSAVDVLKNAMNEAVLIEDFKLLDELRIMLEKRRSKK